MKAIFTIDTKELKAKNYKTMQKPAEVKYPKPSDDERFVSLLKKSLMK